MRESPDPRPRRTRRLAALGGKNRVAARGAHYRSDVCVGRARRAVGTVTGPERSKARRSAVRYTQSSLSLFFLQSPCEFLTSSVLRAHYVTGKRAGAIIMRASASTTYTHCTRGHTRGQRTPTLTLCRYSSPQHGGRRERCACAVVKR